MTETKETTGATTPRTDISVKEAWTGPARLQLFEHALAPMAGLPVREVVAASHTRVDLILAPFAPGFDYLAEPEEARA
ncbi:MAG TPA: acetoacetate decarboxylase family protein [Mycobacterium sp.]|nr:acetoacetate decarboxylase family protein [Mycobacterium sp.]